MVIAVDGWKPKDEVDRLMRERDEAMARVQALENGMVDAIQLLNGVAKMQGVKLERRLRAVQVGLYNAMDLAKGESDGASD